MEFRIKKLKEFKLIGYKISTTKAWMKGMRDCPNFWKKIVEEKKTQKLSIIIATSLLKNINYGF